MHACMVLYSVFNIILIEGKSNVILWHFSEDVEIILVG